MGEYGNGPWSVNCLEDFLFFCCPECDHRDHSKDSFLQHAFKIHPEAKDVISLLIGVDIKTEVTEDVVEYDIPYNQKDMIDYHVGKKEIINEEEDSIVEYDIPYFGNDINLDYNADLNCEKKELITDEPYNAALKPKYCPTCGKPFSGDNAEQDLKAHIKIHSQPKQKPQYICENCGRDWKYASKLATHKKSCLRNVIPASSNESASINIKEEELSNSVKTEGSLDFNLEYV